LKTAAEKIFQGKINFFSKKITLFVNFGTQIAFMLAGTQKFRADQKKIEVQFSVSTKIRKYYFTPKT